MKVRLKRKYLWTRTKWPEFQFHEGPIKTSPFAALCWPFDGFNSMKVRLKRRCALQQDMDIQFQFHEGPIKTEFSCSYLLLNGRFQFHEGPIKTLFCVHVAYYQRSFNSMKVRLKPYPWKLLNNTLCWFQFHEGPIKTRRSVVSRLRVKWFQFHEGPIKTPHAQLHTAPSDSVSIPWRSD